MEIHNLPDRLDGSQAWLAPERRVTGGVRRGAAAIGDQDGGLHYILGQLEGTWRVSPVYNPHNQNLQASGALARPANMPAPVKVKAAVTVGRLPD